MDSDPPLVLGVDDEASVRSALERALRLEGFAVSTAAGGHEALEAVAQRPPAVIVLDVTMPDLDGVSVVRRLRGGCGARDRGDPTRRGGGGGSPPPPPHAPPGGGGARGPPRREFDLLE